MSEACIKTYIPFDEDVSTFIGSVERDIAALHEFGTVVVSVDLVDVPDECRTETPP